MAGNLDSQTPLSQWYCDDASDTSPCIAAQAAFQEGLVIFRDTLTKDPKKKHVAEQMLVVGTLRDVREAVAKALDHSNQKGEKSTLRKHLTAFSQGLLYYGNVMDVLASHHPEYVALVWGAMKFIFGAVVEHERIGTTIITALNEISDSLPSVELMIALYPTAMMKSAASLLYAHIIKFLIRARNYYEESKLLRAIHSVTRPSALRYDDLIRLIRRDTEALRKHAAASCQAEIRDLHQEMRLVRTKIEANNAATRAENQSTQAQMTDLVGMLAQIRQTIDFERAVHASAQIQIRAALTDVQLRQALTMISSQCRIDHKSVFQTAKLLRDNRYRGRSSGSNSFPFWSSNKLRDWNRTTQSSAVLLKPTSGTRPQTRSFCTEVIEYLLKSRTAALWVLLERGQTYPVLEALKSLVYQALSLNYSTHTEHLMSFELGKFLDAHGEDDYLNMLASLLQSFKLVYIIVDTEAMSPDAALVCRNSLRRLSCLLSERESKVILKVLVTSHRPEQHKNSIEDWVIPVGKTSSKAIRKQRKTRSRRTRGGPSSLMATLPDNP